MAAINPLGGRQPLGFNNSDQMAQTSVRIEVTIPRPTAEQLADAVFTTLKISETDRNAMKQANGGKDVRDSLAADFKKGGIKHSTLMYTGGGRYAGQVGMPEEMHRRLVEWAKTDGDAPAETPPGAATKRGEVQAQGAYTKHKAELALRKQEAYQKIARGELGKGGAQAAATMTRTLPTAASFGVAEAVPLAIGVIGAAGAGVVLDKGLELGIERQMEAVRNAPPLSMSKGQDEPPPVETAEKPQAQPEIKVAPEGGELAVLPAVVTLVKVIKVAPEGGELVKPDAAPPATTSQPTSTQPAAPQGQPPGNNPLSKLVGPAIGAATATIGTVASNILQMPTLKYPRTQQQYEDLARDPAHGNQVTVQGEHERKIALELENQNELDGPVVRDATGAAEFIDTNKVSWDVKSLNSNFPPRKGGYELKDAVRKIERELRLNENVIVDATNMKKEHVEELLQVTESKGWADRVKWYIP